MVDRSAETMAEDDTGDRTRAQAPRAAHAVVARAVEQICAYHGARLCGCRWRRSRADLVDAVAGAVIRFWQRPDWPVDRSPVRRRRRLHVLMGAKLRSHGRTRMA